MDEFAQTRGVDDLFDDDIVPVTAQAEEVPVEEDPPPTEAHPAEFVTPAGDGQPENDQRNNAAPAEYRKRGGFGRGRTPGERGRGRGRGFGRGGRGAAAATRDAGQEKGETTSAPAPAPASASAPADDQEQQETLNESTAAENGEEGNQSKEPGKSKVYAVKGDRSGTGGVKKPKLTEDELSERMAAVKIKSAERAAAHARAEADEASFRERERVAQEKQRQERANRRVMNGEREKNRQRKLDAQTGRAWDAEKNEETLSNSRGRGSGYRRGMHGGIAYDAPKIAGHPELEGDWENGRQHGNNRGRGPRGGRGGGRGRGRGRGGGFGRDGKTNATDDRSPQHISDAQPSQPSFNSENDFPALPTGTEAPAKLDASGTAPSTDPASPGTPATPAGTWAEQMESSSQPSRPTGEVDKTSGG